MIPVAEPLIGEKEIQYVNEALRSGWISSRGKFITEFEERFAARCGMKHGVATANGTVSLHLALAAMGIGPGDEVIVPALTFVSTANVVTHAGARAILADVRESDWGLDPDRLEEAITPRTKAIIPVHLYGHPCDMDPIAAIARRRGIRVLEDAAEAHGGSYRGRPVGSLGDISSFSFYGNKTITTGEGGICLTNDDDLAARMRILRDHGAHPQRRYWYEVVGFNYRMTNLQAAVGVAQLERLDEFVERKRRIAAFYARAFAGLAAKGRVALHPDLPWGRCTFWLYGLRVLPGDGGPGRDDLIHALAGRQIETRPFFPSIHRLPPYHGRSSDASLPVSIALSETGISLPSGVTITEPQLETVAAAVREILTGRD